MSAPPPSPTALRDALAEGDPARVAALIAQGADLHYTRDHGYDALLDAVHGRDIVVDDRLLDLLRVLIANGVRLNGVSSYQESGVRVLSLVGRFDALRLLLDAGADETQLGWTPLIRAVAIGSLGDVERLLESGASLEETDWWSRTAYLVALLAGDLEKVEALVRRGADVHARGRCAQPPLFYAVRGRHADVVTWLLAHEQGVDQTDQFEGTALMEAVEYGDIPCVDLLIARGANVDRKTPSGSVLSHARSREVALRLLDAGADPGELAAAVRRSMVGLPPNSDPSLLDASPEEFSRARSRRFGVANPERLEEPFLLGMVRSGLSAYHARERYEPGSRKAGAVFSAQRFGQSITLLPDGRVVQIGGEHEDSYDPDFCIYNDVFVHGLDGRIAIYGYPESVFPPTDFHTATLVENHVYVIGSFGYPGARRPGFTPVYRIDLGSFRIEPVVAVGEVPGWIHKHRATRSGGTIRVWGGHVITVVDGRERCDDNLQAFILHLGDMTWRRDTGT
jgi:ankyrin repeat protein